MDSAAAGRYRKGNRLAPGRTAFLFSQPGLDRGVQRRGQRTVGLLLSRVVRPTAPRGQHEGMTRADYQGWSSKPQNHNQENGNSIAIEKKRKRRKQQRPLKDQ